MTVETKQRYELAIAEAENILASIGKRSRIVEVWHEDLRTLVEAARIALAKGEKT